MEMEDGGDGANEDNFEPLFTIPSPQNIAKDHSIKLRSKKNEDQAMEMEDRGDGVNRDNFEVESDEHKKHEGDKRKHGAEIGGLMVVETDTSNDDDGKDDPENLLYK
ncbi:hypothetical protein RJT34_15171 [Clitoria ternatea]|uniref:Uncharacterized protein n=1 Tax=Clitoria ternatea TaxID=43366 RepID=A0AAN9PNL5_CLITE